MPVPLDAFLKKADCDTRQFDCFPLLPRQGMMIIGAQPKVGKSTVALNIAYDLAEGRNMFGHELYRVDQPMTVLLMEQEIGEYSLRRRLNALNMHRSNMYVGQNLWIESKDLDCQLDTPEGLRKIEEHIAAAKPHVVIYDPLTWFHSKSENDNTEMHKVSKAIAKLNKKFNTSAIIVHHNTKPGEFRTGTGMASLRGGSTIAGDVDTICSLSQPTNDRRFLRMEFILRHAGDPFDHPLNFEVNKDTLGLMRR